MKDLNYYLNLPYTVLLRPGEDNTFVARVEELPGCVTDGATIPEAIEKLDDLKRAWIDDAIEAGHAVPEPVPEEPLPSGKWVQRVPKSLHRKLTSRAHSEGVSLNTLVTSMLSEAIGMRTGHVATVHDQKVLSHWHSFDAWQDAEACRVYVSTTGHHRLPEWPTLSEALQLLRAGLPKNHKRLSLKAIHDHEKDQRFEEVC